MITRMWRLDQSAFMIMRVWSFFGLLLFRGQVGAGLLVGDGGGRWDGTGGAAGSRSC